MSARGIETADRARAHRTWSVVAACFAAMASIAGCDDTRSAPTTRDDETEPGSAGVLRWTGLDPASMNAAFQPFGVELGGAAVSSEHPPVVTIDGVMASDGAYVVTERGVSIPDGFPPGRHEVSVVVSDTAGGTAELSAAVWFGASELSVTVLDPAGDPVDAMLLVYPAEAPWISARAGTTGGVATLRGLPTGTLVIEASGPSGSFGTVSVTDDAGAVQMVVRPMNQPSTIVDNAFEAGGAGWDTGDAPVTLVAHQVAETPSPGGSLPKAGDPLDLQLTTSGEGPRTISRTFTAASAAREVRLRFRFVTTEVPEYFGSEYNDSCSVTIRTAARRVTRAVSMNGLGLSAFDPTTKSTGWMDVSLPVEPFETVQVEVQVSNVGDGILDSSVVIDDVSEGSLSIRSLSLRDLDGSELRYLSVGNRLGGLGGRTPIHATLEVLGDAGDRISAMDLEVVQNGAIVARASALPAALAALSGPLFPGVGLGTPQAVFEFPPGGLDALSDDDVTLRVKVRGSSGAVAEWAHRPAGAAGSSLPVMRSIDDGSLRDRRYGGRDDVLCSGSAVTCGGDGWARPGTLASIGALLGQDASIAINDLGNMHGGEFPPHASHKEGRDADVGWSGFCSCMPAGMPSADCSTSSDGDVAALLRALSGLDAVEAERIESVFLTFADCSVDDRAAIESALATTSLADGRRATSVVRSVAGHRGHAHIRYARW